MAPAVLFSVMVSRLAVLGLSALVRFVPCVLSV